MSGIITEIMPPRQFALKHSQKLFVKIWKNNWFFVTLFHNIIFQLFYLHLNRGQYFFISTFVVYFQHFYEKLLSYATWISHWKFPKISFEKICLFAYSNLSMSHKWSFQKNILMRILSSNFLVFRSTRRASSQTMRYLIKHGQEDQELRPKQKLFLELHFQFFS